LYSNSDSEFRNDAPEYEPREGLLSRGFRVFVAVLVLAVVIVLGVWALSGPKKQEVSKIAGFSGEDRRQPMTQEDTLPAPIYDRLARGDKSEHGRELLSPDERPIIAADLPAQIAQQPWSAPSTSVVSQRAGDAAATASSDALSKANASSPTDSVNADNANRLPQEPAALPPLSPPLSPLGQARETAEATLDRAQAAAPPDALAKPEAGVTTAYRIQVASVRTSNQARSEWNRIKVRHADLLGKLEGYYPSMQLSSGTWYRVQAGPLVDEALADLVCSQLKARRVDCFVIAP